MAKRLAPWLLPILVAWMMFCTLRATSWERIQSLRVVESYGLAVYEQLIRNYAFEGAFFQTVHRGYIDHWMWSGHRSVFLFVIARFYEVWPGPLTLTSVQIALVSLGCLPAFGVGRRVVGGVIGGCVGLLFYAGFPPLWVIALNDYQDIVLGVPFAMTAFWAMRVGNPWGFALAAFGAACMREEWAVTLPVIGLAAHGGLRGRARYVGIGVGVAVAFGALAWWLGRDARGYETPMNTQLTDMLHGLPPIQRTWADVERFYQYFLRPVNGLAILSPLTVLPALGAFGVHISTPNGSGIDAAWNGHIHHTAPIAAFLVLGAIDGVGVLFGALFPAGREARWKSALAGRHQAPAWARFALLGVAAIAFAVHSPGWARMLKLDLRATPALTESRAVAPEWAVVRELPADAVVATDIAAALVVAGRRRSFTYEESLPDKSRIGLSELDYLLVRRSHSTVEAAALALGATLVTETPGYRLYQLPKAGR